MKGHGGSNPSIGTGLVEVNFKSVYCLIIEGCNVARNDQSKHSTLDMCIDYEYLK
jgi:hypothetical protein